MTTPSTPLLGTIILLVMLGLTAAIGLLLCIWCLRGKRIDDHPVCRKCGYDLSGATEPYDKCSECGADLTANRAIRIGNRKKRIGSAVVTGAVVLIAAVLFVMTMINAFGNSNLNAYKPFWLLKLEATSTVFGPNDQALDELLLRTQTGSLSAGRLDDLLGTVLKVQADTSIPWDETWGDVFGELFTQGVGTQAQYDQYAQRIYDYSVIVRPRVVLGKRVAVATSRSADRGQGDSAHYYFVEHGDIIEIDGLVLDRTQQGGSGSGFVSSAGHSGGGTSFGTDSEPFDQLQPGQYDVTYTEPTEIRLGSSSGPMIAEFDRMRRCPLELLPVDAEEVALFTDPQAAAAMEAGISIKDNRIMIRPQKNRPQYINARFKVELDGTTVPFGYQMLVEYEGKEYRLAEVARSGPTTNTSHGFATRWPSEVDADRVDVIFRPHPDAARGTVDVYRILDHEFVIRDVEVVLEP